MIVSHNPDRSKSRWLQACVLLCAMVVLPLGVASAEDIEAVWERLQTAVKKGEITEKQAHIMMGALKGSLYEPKKKDSRGEDSRNERPDRERIDAHVREIWGKLQHAVKEGKMSQEDAHKKMGEIKKRLHGRAEHRPGRGMGEEERVHARLGETWKRLKHAVGEGKMSKEDAGRKMSEIKKEALSRFDRKDKDRRQERHEKGGSTAEQIGRWVKSVGEDIRKAAEAGKITREQAWAKWRGFKGGQLAPKLKAAVKEGKMSEQAAREFWRKVEAAEKHEAAARPDKTSKEDAAKKTRRSRESRHRKNRRRTH